MSEQTKQFEALEINKELTDAERKAIDDLVVNEENKAAFKLALQKEKLGTVNKSFLEIANDFTDCDINRDKNQKCFTYDVNTEARLKLRLEDPNHNDFAYLIWKVSDLLQVKKESGLEAEKLGIQTAVQLKALKTEIEKTEVKEQAASTETLTEADITDKFTLYSQLTPQNVVDAVNTLKTINPTLADEIVPLLKKGNIKGVQIALGMVEGKFPLYKRADGLFGRSTLTNLEAGKVVEPTTGVDQAATQTKEEEEKMEPKLANTTVANRARYLITYGHKSFKEAYGTRKADGFGSTKISDYNQADIDRIDRTITGIINKREGIDRHPYATEINIYTTKLEDIIVELSRIKYLLYNKPNGNTLLEKRIDVKLDSNVIKHLFFKGDGNVVIEPDNLKKQWEIKKETNGGIMTDIIIDNNVSLKKAQNKMLKEKFGIDKLYTKADIDLAWSSDQLTNTNNLEKIHHLKRTIEGPTSKIKYYPIKGYDRLYPNDNDNYNTIKK